jgi:hypothetical protein
VPAQRDRRDLIDVLERRFPQERAVSNQPKVVLPRACREDLLHVCLVVLLRSRGEVRERHVRHDAMCPGRKFWCKPWRN